MTAANVTMLGLRAGGPSGAEGELELGVPRSSGGPQQRPEDFMRADIVILGDANQASNRRPALG